MSIIEILQNVLNNASQSLTTFSNVIKPVWTCNCCSKQSSNADGKIIYLDNDTKNRKIDNLLQNKYLNLKEEHLEKALTELICHNQNFDLRLQSEQKSCAFYSTENIELYLLELLPSRGKVWKCVGAISNTGESFF